MKKTILLSAVLFAASLLTNAQDLPAKVKTFLSRNYPDWQISKKCVERGGESIVAGDFNGDRLTDYAVAISKGNRSYTLALLATADGYKAFNLQALNLGDGVPTGDLGVQRRNTEVVKNPKSEYGGSYRVKTDAVVIGDCGADYQTFYWSGGKFVNVEADLIPKSVKELYTGYQYDGKKLPQGLESLGGFVVAENESEIYNSPFAINILCPKGGKIMTMVWFEKRDETAPKNRRFEVLDVAKIPNFGKNAAFAMGQCYLNNKFDGQIFAVAVDEEKEFYTKIIRAWRADVTSGLIEDISADGIKCVNDGYGV